MKISGWEQEVDYIQFSPESKKTSMIILTIDSEEKEVVDYINGMFNSIHSKFPNNKIANTGFSVSPGELIEFESFEIDEIDEDDGDDGDDGDLRLDKLNIELKQEAFYSAEHPINSFAKGSCQKCGNKGSWINLALVCPNHGIFAG